MPDRTRSLGPLQTATTPVLQAWARRQVSSTTAAAQHPATTKITSRTRSNAVPFAVISAEIVDATTDAPTTTRRMVAGFRSSVLVRQQQQFVRGSGVFGKGYALASLAA
jgi:hypothetical protein